MKYKIITDSSSNLYNDYLTKEYNETEIGFEVIPFTLTFDNKEIVDDDNVNSDEVLSLLKKSKVVNSSCPTPYLFEKACTAEYNFIITVGGKLSGSLNSASIAMQTSNNKVVLIDSKGAGGGSHIIVDKLYELLKQNLSFEEIEKSILSFRDNLDYYFTFTNYDNFVKKGRMNGKVAKLIQLIKIKALCKGIDGEVSLDKTFLTFSNCLKRVKDVMVKKQNKNDMCVITYCGDSTLATKFESELKQLNLFKKIVVNKGKGLHSFYAMNNSLVISF